MIWTAESLVVDYYEHEYRRRKHAGKSPRTIEEYRVQLKNFERFFAAQAFTGPVAAELGRRPRLGDLSDGVIADAMSWQQLRSPTKSAATANKIRSVLVAIWNDAARPPRKIISSRPDVEAFDEPNRIISTWTPEEFAALLGAAKTTAGDVLGVPAPAFWKALLVANYYTGARITALMLVRCEHVNLARKSLKLIAENQKQKSDQLFQPLPEDCLAALQAIEPAQYGLAERDYLFPWPYDPNRRWKTLRRHLTRLLKAAKLPATRLHKFHNIRRMTGTRVFATAGLEAAREYLGHSDRKVTERYIDSQQAAPPRKPGELLPPPDPPKPPLRLFDAG